MSPKEWIAAGGLMLALLGAAINFGRMAGELDDAREEIRLLRAEIDAINRHFITWATTHQER